MSCAQGASICAPAAVCCHLPAKASTDQAAAWTGQTQLCPPMRHTHAPPEPLPDVRPAMNRRDDVPFNTGASGERVDPAAAAKHLPTGRAPQDRRESIIHVPMKVGGGEGDKPKTTTSDSQPARISAVQRSAGKWKSSFKPIDGQSPQDGDSQDSKSTSSSERAELYDPFHREPSDSEAEMPKRPNYNHSVPDQDNNVRQRHLSPDRSLPDSRHWDMPYSEPGSRPLNRHQLSPETRPTGRQGHRLPEQWARGPDTAPLDPVGYGSIHRPLDHRGRSPDMPVHNSSTQQFAASYRGHGTSRGEGISIPEYRREIATSVRLSPPRLQQDYQHQLGYVGTGHATPSQELTKKRGRSIMMDKSPANCDLCDIELASGQELRDHLESKNHWDTLEHIQQQNNYDDLAIAFLQEVLLYKSLKCRRAIDDSALQALQENDYMTKVEMFHCAACQVFVSTSASSVQNHITSLEHLSNTKDFEVRRRRACLDKSDAMMKELKPQFEHFLQGCNPFE